jgi:RNA polymerase sigma-70 factor (ECF subfamily)
VNILDRETLDRLRKALAGLSPRLREAIVLCGFEERSYQEAASILGIPVGTVRSRLNKARNILRQQMLEV